MDYEKINLEDYVKTGEGGQGIAYTHKTDNRLVKLYNPGFEADVAVDEFGAAQAMYELGVPTPRPYRLVTDGERVGAEYELIEGKRSFARIISQEPDRMEEVSLTFARVARELHAVKADTSRLPSMKKRIEKFYNREDVVPAFARDIVLPILDRIPDTPTCLHGDMQIGNIITDGRRNLWIDIGQAAYGAPEWDLGMCWRVCQIPNPEMTDNLFHLKPEQMQQHWNIFAPAYFGVEPKDMGDVIRHIMPYASIKSGYMYNLAYHKPMTDEMCHRLFDPLK